MNGFYFLVTRMTNMDATVNLKIMDAIVKRWMKCTVEFSKIYNYDKRFNFV